MTKRLYLALMGIDGAGKTSVALELAKSLRDRGHVAEVVSGKRVMDGDNSPTSSILAHISIASLTCQYAEAVPAEAAIDQGIPHSRDDVGQFVLEAKRRSRPAAIERNGARPFLSSALLEVAGSMCLQQLYIEPMLEAGSVVINESYGFKHVLKNVLMAQRISPDASPVYLAAQKLLDIAQSLFGALLQPTHGYWIDTHPDLALRWRTMAGEPATAFEDYGLLGDAGNGAFVAMQQDCRRGFESAARAWKWQRLTMSDRPQDENTGAAVQTIEKAILSIR